MTLEQEKRIREIFKPYTKVGINFEKLRDGLMANLYEEMSDYHRAKDDNDKIRALCGIYILCITALTYEIEELIELTKELRSEEFYKSGLLNTIDMWAKDTKEANYKRNIALYLLMINVTDEVSKMGYDVYPCILETIKGEVKKDKK